MAIVVVLVLVVLVVMMVMVYQYLAYLLRTHPSSKLFKVLHGESQWTQVLVG